VWLPVTTLPHSVNTFDGNLLGVGGYVPGVLALVITGTRPVVVPGCSGGSRTLRVQVVMGPVFEGGY